MKTSVPMLAKSAAIACAISTGSGRDPVGLGRRRLTCPLSAFRADRKPVWPFRLGVFRRVRSLVHRADSALSGRTLEPRAGSSAGQSSGLIIRRSKVRVLPGPLETRISSDRYLVASGRLDTPYGMGRCTMRTSVAWQALLACLLTLAGNADRASAAAPSDLGGMTVFSDATRLADGKVFAVGGTGGCPTYPYAPCPWRLLLVRYLGNGRLDPSFGGDGVVTHEMPQFSDQAQSWHVGEFIVVADGFRVGMTTSRTDPVEGIKSRGRPCLETGWINRHQLFRQRRRADQLPGRRVGDPG